MSNKKIIHKGWYLLSTHNGYSITSLINNYHTKLSYLDISQFIYHYLIIYLLYQI